MDDSFTLIPDSIENRDALPRPNWNVVASWIESHQESDSLNEYWTQVARDWVNRLAAALPGDYALHESAEFLALAPNAEVGNRVLKWSEYARKTILKTLDGVAADQGYGKQVVLLFGDLESYYDYINDFYPDEGEFALSGGMFLDVGYGHFAICPSYDDNYERTIAHELNHALLRHLPLPLWLNEGVTQVIEDIVADSSFFIVDHELMRRHRSYWTGSTIDMFWSGDSFFSPDDGQELSYHLAQVLFRNLMSDYPTEVKEILNKANYIDAGNEAFVKAIGKSLGDRVSQFLGDGPWTPRSDYGHQDE